MELREIVQQFAWTGTGFIFVLGIRISGSYSKYMCIVFEGSVDVY